MDGQTRLQSAQASPHIVERAATLSAVSRTDWAELGPRGSFYLSHDWLAWVERDPGARVEYLLLRSTRALLGALPVYDVHKETSGEYLTSRFFDGRWSGRYLLGGTRRAYSNQLLIRRGLDSAERHEVAEALLAALDVAVAVHGTDGALLLFLSTPSTMALHAARPDLQPLLLAADMTLPVPGTCFEDYIAMLPPKRRTSVRRERRVFRAADYEVRRERLSSCAREAGPLIASLQRRYGHPGDDAAFADFLVRQAESLDQHSIVITCRRAGRLVGFCLGYEWEDTLFLRMAGFDYERLRGKFEYFNLAFYEALVHAYDRGLKRLHFGKDAYGAKAGRGAVAEPLWAILLPRGSGKVDSRAPGWRSVNTAQRALLSSELGHELDLGPLSWTCA